MLTTKLLSTVQSRSLSKPNERGALHYVIPLTFIILFAVLGTFYLVRSHAQTPLCETPAVNQTVTPDCSNSYPSTYPTRHWLIVESAASALQTAGSTGSNFIKTINNGATYEIVDHQGAGNNDPLPNAIHVESFQSVGAIQTAFADKQIPSYVKVILYDDEDWPGTPVAEREHPFAYVPQAEQIVHTHGLRFMNAPAADLTSVLDPGAGNNYTGYLNEKLATLAKYTDVFEIQAQNAASVSQYTGFAAQAVSEAQQANPSALILLGVTAKNGGPSSEDLINEVNATKRSVNGYWLNIPGGDTGMALPLIQAWGRS